MRGRCGGILVRGTVVADGDDSWMIGKNMFPYLDTEFGGELVENVEYRWVHCVYVSFSLSSLEEYWRMLHGHWEEVRWC